MKTIKIHDKLSQLGISISDVVMGDFDIIGEFTAKRHRNYSDPNYKKYGAFYRSNYERGILVYYLIKKFNLKSFLEIGFGRGYVTFCAAKAFCELNNNWNITTIDPNRDDIHISNLMNIFPKEWFKNINYVKGLSQQELVHEAHNSYDLVYIDGDHSYEATKSDWNMTKNIFNKFLLFDDYHLPSKYDENIKCREAIDEINEETENCFEKELIILDRRLFFDDRKLLDSEIDYGQVLLTRR